MNLSLTNTTIIFSFLLLFSFTIHIILWIKLTGGGSALFRGVGLMIHGLIQSAATFIAFNIYIEIRAFETHYQGLRV